MTNYVTNATIRSLREKRGLTQKGLAEKHSVSDKAVSKWETGRGLPDITLLEPLAKALGVSVAELLSGECIVNRNRSANLLRGSFYVCPVCGNVLWSTGQGSFSCCGVALPSLEAETPDAEHDIRVETIDCEHYVHIEHPMERAHYISFLAYVTTDRVELVKLYPEMNAETHFRMSGPGRFYAYCKRHGLFEVKSK